MEKWLKIAYFFIALTVISGCGYVTSTSWAPTSPQAANTDILYMSVSTTYDHGSSSTLQGTCSIASNASLFTNSTCAISIPEEQLYDSSTTFFISGSASTCNEVAFYPYYFVLSNSAAYTPPWSSTSKDCSGDKYTLDIANCVGGSAPEMLSGAGVTFGLDVTVGTRGIYWLTDQTTNKTFTASSPHSKNWLDTRYITNNLPSGSRDSAHDQGPDAHRIGYSADLGFPMHDYVVECRDRWDNSLYSITVTISNSNPDPITGGAPSGNLYDWLGN